MRGPSGSGPEPLKAANDWLPTWTDSRKSLNAFPIPPTVITAGAFPGELTVFSEGSSCDPRRPEFPAATTTTFPKSTTAFWAAAASGSQAAVAAPCPQSRPVESHRQKAKWPRLKLRMSIPSRMASSIAAITA